MDVRQLRDALRVLRVESGLGVRDVPGLDKATVHRIENTREYPRYQPTITSVATMVAACSVYSLATFLATLEKIATMPDAADLLSKLTDARTVQQVHAFLTLDDGVRQALASTRPPPRTSDTSQPPIGAPTPGATPEGHTTSPGSPRPLSALAAHRKTASRRR